MTGGYEWGDGVYTLLSWFEREKVRNARILVAGAGALGNEVIKNLALFGIGHIYVVDFDRIELSNLTRSVLFREEDAREHSYKAEVAARRAMEINPQIKVMPIVGNLFSDVGLGVYRSADVVIGCLDSRLARYQLNRLSFRAGKSWIDGSIENLTGAVQVYSPGISCYECNLSREEFNNIMLRTGCADVVRVQTKAGRIATTPVSASVVGAIQAQEAMKIVHLDDGAVRTSFKTLQGKMLYFQGMTNAVHTFRRQSWKTSCPAHDIWKTITNAPSLSAGDTVESALEKIREVTGSEYVEINMLNNKFVDFIVSDRPEKEFQVRIPESRLEDFMKSDTEIDRLSKFTVFHKSYIENIDDTFPYKDMTLHEIGIPYFDVVQVSTGDCVHYVELSQDAAMFE